MFAFEACRKITLTININRKAFINHLRKYFHYQDVGISIKWRKMPFVAHKAFGTWHLFNVGQNVRENVQSGWGNGQQLKLFEIFFRKMLWRHVSHLSFLWIHKSHLKMLEEMKLTLFLPLTATIWFTFLPELSLSWETTFCHLAFFYTLIRSKTSWKTQIFRLHFAQASIPSHFAISLE